MVAPSSVRISGTILASLLYECANSKGDQEGVLTGTLATQTTGIMSDASDTAEESVEQYIIVQGYHCLSSELDRPYDSMGSVQPQALADQLSCLDGTTVIGYFRFRRQSELILSAREQALVRSLSTILDSRVAFHCTAIITVNLSPDDNPSTHSYEFAFWDNASLSKIPVHIVNMTESALAYQQLVPSIAPSSAMHDQIFQDIQPASIMQQYDAMYHRAIRSLQKATHDVSEKEAKLHELQQQIQELEQKNM